jgi:hypothetical protein
MYLQKKVVSVRFPKGSLPGKKEHECDFRRIFGGRPEGRNACTPTAGCGRDDPAECDLAKFEGLQRQVDDLKSVADLDASFGELAERVRELEKTNSLEARFAQLANEAKRGSEPQSELLERIVELEHRFDYFKKIANQPGPQGPPGKDGKLPIVEVCDGSTYQALRDTGQNVNHADWVCLARAGRDGCDGRSPNVCGACESSVKNRMAYSCQRHAARNAPCRFRRPGQ